MHHYENKAEGNKTKKQTMVIQRNPYINPAKKFIVQKSP